MIRCFGHVALTVTDLQASVAFATGVLGLREMERRDGTVYLTANGAHHAIEYRQGPATRMDHFALHVDGGPALDELRAGLERAGIALVPDLPAEPNVEAAVRFRTPAGHLVEACVPAVQGLPPYHWLGQPPHVPSGVRPRRAQHINVNGPDQETEIAFFVDVLGFRVSDQLVDPEGRALMTFLHGSQDHHDVAIGEGPPSMLHVAFEVDSALDLIRLGDLLDSIGRHFLWGPGRHAAGDNIATYFLEPSGVPIEFYSDMERIDDSRRPVRRYAITDPRVASIWGPSGDLLALRRAGVPSGAESPRAQPVP
jgi:catechol 2,3-dioxygenase-like lactoylglutathione lyase family enzyme